MFLVSTDICGEQGRLLLSWLAFTEASFRHKNSEIIHYQAPSFP
jgi:hypothetical protein